MSKLYELLAVERDLSKTAKESIAASVALFGNPGKLTGQNISYHTILDGEPDQPKEITVLAHTVEKELAELRYPLRSYIDVTVQKEASNTKAKSTVFVKGEPIIKDLPATALLNLESRLDEVRKVYEAIPVIDVSERWEYSEGQGCYVSAVRESLRTKKQLQNHVLSEATKEHPANVQVMQVDVPAYKVEKVIQSGMLTPAEKAEKLERLTELQQAVKRARQRANDVEIEAVQVADKIFDYINTGTF